MIMRTFLFFGVISAFAISCGDVNLSHPAVKDEEKSVQPTPIKKARWNHGALKCVTRFEENGVWKEIALSETSSDANSSRHEVNYGAMNFKVDHNDQLNTLYTFITANAKEVYFATLRIPTQDHNDSVGIFTDTAGSRWILSCAFQ